MKHTQLFRIKSWRAFLFWSTVFLSAALLALMSNIAQAGQKFSPPAREALSSNSHNTEVVGYIGGGFSKMFIQGDYAYFGEGPRLIIMDVSDPAALTPVGHLNTYSQYISKVIVAGDYAYVAASEMGLRIMDISDPAHPNEVSYYYTPNGAWGVALDGNYAYVLCGTTGGLRVLDVADPVVPIEIGHHPTPGRDIKIVGSYAYIVDYYNGLRVVDIADPTNPVEVGFYDIPEDADAVEIAGNYAYIAGRDAMRIVDISDPVNPFEVGHYNTSGHSWDVSVAGSYAYVATQSWGVRIIDISDPANPSEVGTFDAFTNHVTVVGGHAYTAGFSHLYTVDITTPTDPQEVGTYFSLGMSGNVDVADDFAYVIEPFLRDMLLIDVSVPSSPIATGVHTSAFDMTIVGSYAFVQSDYMALEGVSKVA